MTQSRSEDHRMGDSVQASGMRIRIQEAFFAWGWLLPTLLPLAQVLGRAVFTILGLIYCAWAMFSLYGQKVEFEPRILLLYAILLVAFFLGVPGAIDGLHGLRTWCKFMLYTSVFWITWAVVQRTSGPIERLLIGFGMSALAALVILYLRLAIAIQQPSFDPTLQMNEDNLPLLTPFLLYLVQYRARFKYRHWMALLLVGLIGLYVVLSQGRAALVGLVTALFMYVCLVTAWRKQAALALAAGVLLLGIMGSGSHFLRGASGQDSLMDILDKASSYRTVLWRQALASPPDSPLVGVGMGNTPHYATVLSISLPSEGTVLQVKHLHNFLFDAWYETGLIGLGALLLWLTVMLRRGLHAWRKQGGAERIQAGVLLASALAILANALLSYSYRSEQFGVYLFLSLTALAYLDGGRNSKAYAPTAIPVPSRTGRSR